MYSNGDDLEFGTCLYCHDIFEMTRADKRFCNRRCKEQYRKNGGKAVGERMREVIEKREYNIDPTKRNARYQKTIENAKNNTYLRTYGITYEEAQKLKNETKFCAICGTDSPGKIGWVLDHCHTTNKLRDVLCMHCNTGLGHFRDNIEIIQRAIEYLENWKKRHGDE